MSVSAKSAQCLACANKDITWALHGSTYKQELVCAYGMTRYPHAVNCDKFEDKAGKEVL